MSLFRQILRAVGILPRNDVLTFDMPADLMSELSPGDGLVQYCGVFFFTWDGVDDVLHYEEGAHPELESVLRRAGATSKDRTLQFVSEWTEAGPGSAEATDAADRFLECGAGKIGFYADRKE